MEIREAVPHDLLEVVDLWKELMDFHKELNPVFTRSTEGAEGFLKRIEVHILDANSVAQGFWQKMGFKPFLTGLYKEN